MILTPTERFWSKVDKTATCWLWAGTIRKENGYGRFWFDGRHHTAHRVVYELLVGPVPDGLTLDHLCRNRNCVNPAHLEPVTHQENVKRGNSGKFHASKTHCPKGHEYIAENTRLLHRGKYTMRQCRTCVNTRKREVKHEASLLRQK